MTPTSVAVIIVNWRIADLVSDCLHSLAPERSSVEKFRVVVVDNDSQDGSAEVLEKLIAEQSWEAWVQLIRADSNGGFAAGNNIAIREILEAQDRPEFIFLLNPDTVVRRGAIELLASFLLAHPGVGIAGSRNEDEDTTPQYCSFRFPGAISEFARQINFGLFDRVFANHITRMEIPEVPMQVDWVSGAAMMVRVEVFDLIGLLDESYFLYFEETDFILRARKAGWSCWHVPASRVVHLVGQSSGVTKREGELDRIPNYWFESRRRYFVLNHGLSYALLTDLAVMVGACIGTMRGWLRRGRQRRAPYFLRDFIRHSVWIRGGRGLAPRKVRL